MDSVLQNYIKIIQSGIDKKPLKKYELTSSDFASMHDRIVDLYNLVAFADNSVLADGKIARDMFLNNKFLERTIVIDTDSYNNCVRQVPQLKDLQDGQTITISPQPSDNLISLRSYQYTRKGNLITEYSILHTIKQSNIVTNPNWNLENLANSDDAEFAGGKVYFPLNLSSGPVIATAFMGEDGKVKAVCYDDRENPFDSEHVLLFDKNGNKEPLKKQNFVHLLSLMRHSVAHHSVYNFCPNTLSQGKLFCLDDGRFLLCSTSWVARVVPENQRAVYGEDTKFKYFYVSKGDVPVRNAEQLKEKLNNECFLISIYNLNPPVKKEVMDRVIDTIMNKYRLAQKSIKTSAKEYFETNLKRYFPSCQVQLSTDNNYTQLLSRLTPAADPASAQKFFNFSGNAKYNRDMQNYVIDYLVNEIYGAGIVTTKQDNPADKFVELPLDLKNLSDCYDRDIEMAYCCVEGKQSQRDPVLSMAERYTALCIMGIYSTLICNNFYDKFFDAYRKHRTGFVVDKESRDLIYQVGGLDMSMFDIKSASLTQESTRKPKNLEDNYIVLKALRNAICHNSVSIKQNRTGDYNLNTLSFYDFRGRCCVSVQEQSLVKFLSSPIFNIGSNQNKTLQSTSYSQVLQEIKKFASLQTSQSGDTSEFI